MNEEFVRAARYVGLVALIVIVVLVLNVVAGIIAAASLMLP